MQTPTPQGEPGGGDRPCRPVPPAPHSPAVATPRAARRGERGGEGCPHHRRRPPPPLSPPLTMAATAVVAVVVSAATAEAAVVSPPGDGASGFRRPPSSTPGFPRARPPRRGRAAALTCHDLAPDGPLLRTTNLWLTGSVPPLGLGRVGGGGVAAPLAGIAAVSAAHTGTAAEVKLRGSRGGRAPTARRQAGSPRRAYRASPPVRQGGGRPAHAVL